MSSAMKTKREMAVEAVRRGLIISIISTRRGGRTQSRKWAMGHRRMADSEDRWLDSRCQSNRVLMDPWQCPWSRQEGQLEKRITGRQVLAGEGDGLTTTVFAL